MARHKFDKANKKGSSRGKSRDNKNKLIRGILVLFIIVVFLCGLLFLPVYMPTFASVSRIELHLNKDYIAQSKVQTYLTICGISSDAIWKIPSKQVAECIKSKNVLIDKVSFAYWKGVLTVSVTEPSMLFAVKTDDTVYYVSNDNRAFRIDAFDNVPQGLETFYIPKTGALTDIEIKGLHLISSSILCKQLFKHRGTPGQVYIIGNYARLTYTSSNTEKVVIIPLYDLEACERVDKYWDKIWQSEGKYVDFTHRRIIVVKDTP
jgi:hypothetical protein